MRAINTFVWGAVIALALATAGRALDILPRPAEYSPGNIPAGATGTIERSFDAYQTLDTPDGP